MLFEKFNMKEYVKMEKRDSYEDGRLEGEERLSRLIQLLIAESRTDEISKVANDKKYRNKLFSLFCL